MKSEWIVPLFPDHGKSKEQREKELKEQRKSYKEWDKPEEPIDYMKKDHMEGFKP